jgi:hypothetical protein
LIFSSVSRRGNNKTNHQWGPITRYLFRDGCVLLPTDVFLFYYFYFSIFNFSPTPFIIIVIIIISSRLL